MPKTLAGAAETRLCTYDEASAAPSEDALAVLADWMAESPMSGHVDLGRAGVVCPFLKKAALADTLRIGISQARPGDEDAVFALIRGSFGAMREIPEPPGRERLSAIVYGFPNCAMPDGVAMLGRVFKRHKYYSLARSVMMAFFHADSDAHGLWNPDFRPMRSPMPVLGMRYMVEQDAVFAARHHLMLGPYLLRYGVSGIQRVAAARRQKTASERYML
jgi:hypothetical protein